MGTPCLIVKHNVQSQLREDDELISIEVSFCRENNWVLERVRVSLSWEHIKLYKSYHYLF